MAEHRIATMLPHRIYFEANSSSTKMVFSMFDSRLLNLFTSFSFQTIIKFILTEGEKYVLMLFQTLSDQGVYDLVSHLGSMAARIIFQPIEETSHTTWSKLLSTSHGERFGQKHAALKASASMLVLLLKFCSLIGLTFICFGPAYSYSLLRIVYGVRWSETNAPMVLSLYCVYVFFMAINGITEAFVHAASSERQTRSFNYWMMLFSMVYLTAAIFFIKWLEWGTPSLVIANIVNMLMRIMYCQWFIRQYFTRASQANQGQHYFQWSEVIPHRVVLLFFMTCLVVTKCSEAWLEHSAWTLRATHISIGTACIACLCGMVAIFERQFLSNLRKLFQGRKLD